MMWNEYESKRLVVKTTPGPDAPIRTTWHGYHGETVHAYLAKLFQVCHWNTGLASTISTVHTVQTELCCGVKVDADVWDWDRFQGTVSQESVECIPFLGNVFFLQIDICFH